MCRKTICRYADMQVSDIYQRRLSTDVLLSVFHFQTMKEDVARLYRLVRDET